jgi:CubicO group peptidase (beta-lactamase class C family)
MGPDSANVWLLIGALAKSGRISDFKTCWHSSRTPGLEIVQQLVRLTLLFLLLVPALVWAQTEAHIDIDEREQLTIRIDEIRQQYRVPALALTIVEGDDPGWTHALGVADLATARPVDGETRFRIGSISKAFAGIALLLAEEQGVLSLDDEVRHLVAEVPFENRWQDTHPISVASLLEHTAGFQDWIKDEWDLNEALPLESALAYRPESRISRWPPRLHSSYSNSGPGVAAWVVEQTSEEEYEGFVRNRIFVPLGMSTAVFQPDELSRHMLATGYDSDAKTVIPYWHVIFRPSAAISLNPRDMAPFIRMLINRGIVGDKKLLTQEMVYRLEHPETTLAARAGLDYGYGLGIYQTQRNGHSLFGHGGDGDGYLAHFAYSLESRRGYFVVINAFTHEPLRRMRSVLEDYVLRGLPKSIFPSYKAKPGELESLTGTYQSQTSRFGTLDGDRTLEIRVKGDRLVTIWPRGKSRDLLPLGSGFFRRPDQSVATTVFARENGALYLQGPMGNYIRIAK